MVLRVTIKVHGAEETKAALRSLPQAFVESELHKVLMDAARPIALAAAAYAPVKTGKLRRSVIRGLRAKGARATKGAAVFVGSTSPLAHLQEWGTAHHPAHPFMRRAYDSNSRAASSAIERGLLGLLARGVQRARRQT